MKYLSTAGHLKYPGLITWSITTWTVGWSGSGRRARHRPAVLQGLRTATFPQTHAQISAWGLVARRWSTGMWQLSYLYHGGMMLLSQAAPANDQCGRSACLFLEKRRKINEQI